MNVFKSFFESISKFINKPSAPVAPVPPMQIPPPPPEPVQVENDLSKPFTTIPSRESGCLTGSQFAQTIMNVKPGQTRENLILEEVKKGNIPNFMRELLEVTVTSGNNVLKYFVMPDVLCIGTDEDFLRVPLNPLTAQKVGDLFACVLPTKKMADQIFKVAQVKINPIPGGPPYDESMRHTKKFVKHNADVEVARAGRNGLLTGQKKDVVICKSLLKEHSGNVAIYGWFYSNGSCIQGLNPSDHDKFYEDYSHGLRYICRFMNLNGQLYDFYDILKDPNLAPLISHEGAYDATQIYKK